MLRTVVSTGHRTARLDRNVTSVSKVLLQAPVPISSLRLTFLYEAFLCFPQNSSSLVHGLINDSLSTADVL